jgi:fused signal recognition particle receptor
LSDKGFFSRLKEGLGKTREGLFGGVKRLFFNSAQHADLYEALEETLISADVGVETTLVLIENLRRQAKEQGIKEPEKLYGLLKQEVLQLLGTEAPDISWIREGEPHVMLIAGVNGSGKTTTAGKIAFRLAQEKRQVLLGAADTFRAAAAEQLTIWAERESSAIRKVPTRVQWRMTQWMPVRRGKWIIS